MYERLESSWQTALTHEHAKSYWDTLTDSVISSYQTDIIYPAEAQIFTAFTLCPFDKVRVVILGQDPYHGPRQAHGLAFSVQTGAKIPPSLRNIYKEVVTDVGSTVIPDGNLTPWTTQGVLLLNTVLTVRAGEPGSHRGLGWEHFTDAVISTISMQKKGVVFLLWGADAQAKINLINTNKHTILTASHPSPLSAHRGFLGCQHFSKTNSYLIEAGQLPIIW